MLKAYSGRWHAQHLSRTPEGHSCRSRHVYDLVVTESGEIRGVFVDRVDGRPALNYSVEGCCMPEGGLRWTNRCLQQPKWGVEVYFRIQPDLMYGVLLGFDSFVGRPFGTPIILSRRRLTAGEFEEHRPKLLNEIALFGCDRFHEDDRP
jgi:hypothetical protein